MNPAFQFSKIQPCVSPTDASPSDAEHQSHEAHKAIVKPMALGSQFAPTHLGETRRSQGLKDTWRMVCAVRLGANPMCGELKSSKHFTI